MSRLVTAMSISDYTGADIDLMVEPTRKVTKATGLAGITSREVVVPRSGRRGSRNLTRYRSDSQIVLEGILRGGTADDTWNQYDIIAGALADSVDTERLLKWTAGDSLRLQQNVNLVSFEGPLEVGPNIIRYQAELRGSDPNVYSQDLHMAYSRPLGSGATGGLKFPLKFPFTFRPPVETVAPYTNSGFVKTPPILELHGELVDPIVRLAPGVEMVFLGTIAQGDTLAIDVDARTVLLNGVDNRRYMFITSKSTWFELPRGSGTVTLIAVTFTPDAYLSLYWRDARD